MKILPPEKYPLYGSTVDKVRITFGVLGRSMLKGFSLGAYMYFQNLKPLFLILKGIAVAGTGNGCNEEVPLLDRNGEWGKRHGQRGNDANYPSRMLPSILIHD